MSYVSKAGTVQITTIDHGKMQLGPGQAKGYNRFPQTFAPIEPTPSEWLHNAVDTYNSQHRAQPVQRLLVDDRAAALLEAADAFNDDLDVKLVVILDA